MVDDPRCDERGSIVAQTREKLCDPCVISRGSRCFAFHGTKAVPGYALQSVSRLSNERDETKRGTDLGAPEVPFSYDPPVVQ